MMTDLLSLRTIVWSHQKHKLIFDLIRYSILNVRKCCKQTIFAHPYALHHSTASVVHNSKNCLILSKMDSYMFTSNH